MSNNMQKIWDTLSNEKDEAVGETEEPAGKSNTCQTDKEDEGGKSENPIEELIEWMSKTLELNEDREKVKDVIAELCQRSYD